MTNKVLKRPLFIHPSIHLEIVLVFFVHAFDVSMLQKIQVYGYDRAKKVLFNDIFYNRCLANAQLYFKMKIEIKASAKS